MTRGTLYRLHKWAAVAAGIFLLNWMVSGIAMILPGSKPERRIERPDYASATVTPAQAVSAVGGQVSDILLIRVAGRLVYQMQTPQGYRLVDAHSGALFTITLELAGQMVRSEYPNAGTAFEKERLDDHDWTYPAGPLPVYRIRAAASGERYYVSPQNGSIRKITPAGRVRGAIESMHTLDLVPGIGSNSRTRKLALAGAVSIGLGAVATGYLIAFIGRRKIQAR